MENFKRFLKTIAPWVILCGSFARHEERESSDIDFYVRQKPQDPEQEPPIDSSYLPDIIKVAKDFGYDIESCVIGSITIPSTETGVRQLEFSYLYKLPTYRLPHTRNVYGVDFIAICDEKDSKAPFYEDCDDKGEWSSLLPDYVF